MVAAHACRDSKYANHFKIPTVGKALDSGHGMRFQLEWSPTPGKAPEMQTVTYAPPTYIGCASLHVATLGGPRRDCLVQARPRGAPPHTQLDRQLACVQCCRQVDIWQGAMAPTAVVGGRDGLPSSAIRCCRE